MHRQMSYALERDLGIVALSILVAILFAYTDAITQIVSITEGYRMIGNIVLGFFYTSVFTSVPATIALIKISETYSIFGTAFLGAIGALLGDLLIFRIARDSISPHLAEIMRKLHMRWIKKALSKPALKWIPIVIGVIIVASPLPDEPGLVLLGFSKTRTLTFAAFSFSANFFGLLLISFFANI